MVSTVPVVKHSKVGVVERQVYVSHGDGLEVHLLRRVELAPLAQDVAQVEPELGRRGKYHDGLPGGPNSIEKFQLEFWLKIPYTENLGSLDKSQNQNEI